MTAKGVVSGLAKTAVLGGVLGAALALGAPARAEAQSFSAGVEFGRPVATYGYVAPRPAYYPHERWDWARREAERERIRAWERREAWRRYERERSHGYRPY